MRYLVSLALILVSTAAVSADLKNYIPIWEQASKLICNGTDVYGEAIVEMDFDNNLITWLNFDNSEEIRDKYFLWGPLGLPQLSKHVLFLEGRLLQFIFDDRVYTEKRDWILAATVHLGGGNSIFQEIETSTSFYKCYPKSSLVPS